MRRFELSKHNIEKLRGNEEDFECSLRISLTCDRFSCMLTATTDQLRYWWVATPARLVRAELQTPLSRCRDRMYMLGRNHARDSPRWFWWWRLSLESYVVPAGRVISTGGVTDEQHIPLHDQSHRSLSWYHIRMKPKVSEHSIHTYQHSVQNVDPRVHETVQSHWITVKSHNHHHISGFSTMYPAHAWMEKENAPTLTICTELAITALWVMRYAIQISSPSCIDYNINTSNRHMMLRGIYRDRDRRYSTFPLQLSLLFFIPTAYDAAIVFRPCIASHAAFTNDFCFSASYSSLILISACTTPARSASGMPSGPFSAARSMQCESRDMKIRDVLDRSLESVRRVHQLYPPSLIMWAWRSMYT